MFFSACFITYMCALYKILATTDICTCKCGMIIEGPGGKRAQVMIAG